MADTPVILSARKRRVLANIIGWRGVASAPILSTVPRVVPRPTAAELAERQRKIDARIERKRLAEAARLAEEHRLLKEAHELRLVVPWYERPVVVTKTGDKDAFSVFGDVYDARQDHGPLVFFANPDRDACMVTVVGHIRTHHGLNFTAYHSVFNLMQAVASGATGLTVAEGTRPLSADRLFACFSGHTMAPNDTLQSYNLYKGARIMVHILYADMTPEEGAIGVGTARYRPASPRPAASRRKLKRAASVRAVDGDSAGNSDDDNDDDDEEDEDEEMNALTTKARQAAAEASNALLSRSEISASEAHFAQLCNGDIWVSIDCCMGSLRVTVSPNSNSVMALVHYFIGQKRNLKAKVKLDSGAATAKIMKDAINWTTRGIKLSIEGRPIDNGQFDLTLNHFIRAGTASASFTVQDTL